MTTPTSSILFIDAAVADADALLAHADPAIEVIRLSAGEDGLGQIAQALAGRTGVQSVHVVSHGTPGEVLLGSTWVDTAALAGYAQELAAIRAALAEGADLMLYGCDVARGPAGQDFIAALSAATGADVAASLDRTGAAGLGGNWSLEASTGAIETAAVGSEDYAFLLAADPSLPAGLKGDRPWTWNGYTFQIRKDGEITNSDPDNPARPGSKWDRYALDGVTAGTRVYVYMGNSSGFDDFLQVDRNGTIIAQNDDNGSGQYGYDSFVTWIYQPGDVIRATTFSAGARGTYSIFIGTSSGVVPEANDIGNAPPPAPPPATAPTFTDGRTLLGTYDDTGASDSFIPLSGSFTAADTTPTGTLRFSATGTSPYGTLAVAANGSYSFVPNADAINALAAGQSATASFTVTVSDGGLSTSKTVTVNLVGANDAPTLSSDATIAPTAEDLPTVHATVAALFGGRFADVDSGASLGGIVVTGNAATAEQGQWQYSTDGGATWFDVGAVSEGAGLALAAATLLRFNPSPDWNGTPGSLTVHATDDAYAGGYTSGAARVSFDTANDAATSGVSAGTRTVSTSVTAVNDAPVFTSDPVAPAAIVEGSGHDGAGFATAHTLTGTLTASDVDSTELAFSIRGGTASAGVWTRVGLYGTLTVDSATGQWTYSPDKSAAVNALAEGQVAHDVFEFKVTDDAGASSIQRIDITLQGSNDLPVLAAAIGDQAFSGAGSWRFQVPAGTFTDAEGQGLAYTAQLVDGDGNPQDLPPWLSFDAATRTFAGDPPPAWNDAALTLRVTATDRAGASVSDDFELTLSNTGNQPPQLQSPLSWTSVQPTREATEVRFTEGLGGTTLEFDGRTIALGSPASGAEVAGSMLGAFIDAGYAATMAMGKPAVVRLADTPGKAVDIAEGTYQVPGGSYTVVETQARSAAQAEVVRVQVTGIAFQEVRLPFDGVNFVFHGPLTPSDLASQMASLITTFSPNWTAAVDAIQTDHVVLTARTTGARADLAWTDFQGAGKFPTGMSPVVVSTLQDGTPGDPEIVVLDSFLPASGATSLKFDGVEIALMPGDDGWLVRQKFIAAMQASGSVHWELDDTYVDPYAPGETSVVLRAKASGDVPDLTSADFVAYLEIPSQLAFSMFTVTQGTAAAAREVEITFDGSYGGAQITIGGATGQAGQPVTATQVAQAVHDAGFEHYDASYTPDLQGVVLTARTPGQQDDLQPPDFGGTYPGAGGSVGTSVTTQGAGWTYTVPADTFVDPEGDVLSYSAWLVDAGTGVATPLVNTDALSFDPATRTFSGNGLSLAIHYLEVRASDGLHPPAVATFQLLVLDGGGSVVPVLFPNPLSTVAVDFASGPGGATWQLPFHAFGYIAAEAGALAFSAVALDEAGDPVALPDWLHFDAATATFSGNPPAGAADVRVQIQVSGSGAGTVALAPITLSVGNANDPLVLVAPIGDQSVAAGASFGLHVAAPFSDPDGGAGGTASSLVVDYAITANGRPLSDYGLDYTVGADGSITFSGNPTAAEASLVIVVTGTERAGGSSDTTSFTLNLHDPAADDALSANNPGAVTIGGIALEGEVLTAMPPTDADGLDLARVRYQWQVSSDNGATWQDVDAGPGGTRGQSATLELTQAEAGKQVRVQAFYNDAGGVAEAPVSTAVAVANADSDGSVAIQGILTPGETVSAVVADGDGLRTATPTYQWYRGATAIEGATYSAYTLTQEDSGSLIRVVVNYVDDFGTATQVEATTGTPVQQGIVAPVAQDDTGSAQEAGGVNNGLGGSNASGNLLANDSDANGDIDASAPITGVRAGGVEGVGEAAELVDGSYTVAGLYGTLTVHRATGAWTYVVDQSHPDVEALTDGGTLVDSFNYTVTDTTGLSDTAVLAVTVHGANDAPTLLEVPEVAVFTEDVAEAIRTTFSIVDPDGGEGFTLRLTVTQGTLRAESSTVMPGVAITGNDTGVLTVVGTSMGAVQNWLSAIDLLYTSAPNERGELNATLTYEVRDGDGPFLQAGTTALNVTAANNPPVIDLGGAGSAGNDHVALFRPRGQEVAIVADDVRITDIDDGDTLGSATVTLAAGAYDNAFGRTYETLRSTAGTVFEGSLGPITITGNGTMQIVLTGPGTHADYEAALRTIVYNNSNPNAFSGDRTITISVTDAEGLASNTGSFATAEPNALIAVGQRIFIDGVDTGYTVGRVVDSQHFVASGPLAGLAPGVTLQFYGAGELVTSAVQSGPVVATTTVLVPWTPVIDMNGNGAGRDHAVTYTEGEAGVAIATPDASITDQDGNIRDVVVTLANPLDGSLERLFISDVMVTQLANLGITVAGNGTHAITLGYDPVMRPNGLDATYFQIGLRAIQYVNTDEMPDTTDRVVTVTSTDMDGLSGVDASTTIHIRPVNDAPTGADATLTATEDMPFTLQAGHFGFADIDGNALMAVTIVSLPASGTLVLDGVAVAAGQSIAVADILGGRLQYLPAANENGPARASFGFKVQDDGGTAHGGSDLAAAANTITFDIAPANDAPVLAPAAPVLDAIGEDDVANAGQLVSSFVGGAGGTGVSDVDTLNNGGLGYPPEDTGRGIAIHALDTSGAAGSGTWQYQLEGSGTWVDISGVAPGQALLLGASDRIRFLPDQANGLTASFSYYLWDGSSGVAGQLADASVRGGSTAYSEGSDTASIEVLDANDAAVVDLNGAAPGTDATVIFRPRGEAVAIVGADLRITDADRIDGDTPDLLVSATVTLGAGALDNLFGTTYETLATTAGHVYAGSLGDILITGNGTGEHGLVGATQLVFSGTGTHADYEAALRTVTYENANPNAYTGDRTVQIVVRDASVTTGDPADGQDSAPAIVTIQVPWTPVVDLNGEDDEGRGFEVTFTERTAGVAVAAADASIVDQDGNIAQVVVTLTNPLDGAAESLFIDPALLPAFASIGITVTGNNTHAITLTGNRDGSAFQLALRAIQYVNQADAPALADRLIQVDTVDVDGNTGVGATTTVHIAAVNDAPVAADGTVTLDEDTAYTFAVADFGYTDIEGHGLGGVVITSLPAAGRLLLHGVAVTAGQEVSAADIAAGLLTYAPAEHANNVQNPVPSFGFRVRDDGGTAHGGVDLSANEASLTLDITPVNDLPTGTDGATAPSVSISGSLREGQTLTANFDIADVDRTPGEIAAATTYQWQARVVPSGPWTDIASATGALHVLSGADVNLEIRVLVRYEDTPGSTLEYTSDIATRPAIAGDADGNITLHVDTPDPVLVVNPEGNVTFSNPGGGSLTVDGLPDGRTVTVDSTGPTTLGNPGGDVWVDTAGPGVVTVTGLQEGATVHTTGHGPVTVADAEGDVRLDNQGPGTVTVTGLAAPHTLHVGGEGPTTLADPEGDLVIHNDGPGTVTVAGLDADTTVTTSGEGPVVLDAPAGDLVLDNQGPGEVTVQGPVADATIQVGGSGQTTVADPAGDLDLVNEGTGYATVSGLADGATLHAAGTGDVYLRQPAGDVTVVNDLADGGDLFVHNVVDGAAVRVGGAGPTTLSNPLGDLGVDNAGPGAVQVRCLVDGKTLSTSGAGDVTVGNPRGSVVLENAGPGAVTVEGVNAGRGVTVSGEGPTTVADPDGDLTLHNAGPAPVDLTGVQADAHVTLAGAGAVAIAGGDGFTLTNDAEGEVAIHDLHAGAVLHVDGTGDVGLHEPQGDFTLANDGTGTVTVHDVAADSTVSTSGTGAIAIAAPQYGFVLDNAGPAVVQVTGLPEGVVLTTLGGGATTVADPAGDVQLANHGTGMVTVQGLGEDRTVQASGSGPVSVADAAGHLTVDNTGTGTVTAHGLDHGATLTARGTGDVVASAPEGDLAVHNQGSGTVTVDAVGAGRTVDVSGSGPVVLAGPAGDLALDNRGEGEVRVHGMADGATLQAGGSNDTIVGAPLGNLAVHNTGTGVVAVEAAAQGATLTASGSGDLVLLGPVGDVTLVNQTEGAQVSVRDPAAGATVHLSGAGSVSVAEPLGSLTVHNDGPGLATTSGLQSGATITHAGAGPQALDLAGLGLGDQVAVDVRDGADVSVHNAGHGAGVAVLDGALTFVQPQGSLGLDVSATASVTVDQPADGAALQVTGSGPVSVQAPAGDLQVSRGGDGVVDVQGMAAGSTLVLEGTGHVSVVSSLAAGERITVDTSGNSNVQLSNLGHGTIDVVGGLDLDGDDTVHVRLTGHDTTTLTVAGAIALDGTELVLELDEHYDPLLHDSITLLANDGDDAVVGHFVGLEEGAVRYLGDELFRITYQGGDGNDVVLTRVNSQPTGAVTVGGTARQYETLTASDLLVGDRDGKGTVSYQWFAGATLLGVGLSWVVTQAEVGKAIHVVASYTDQHGTVETLVSEATAVVENVQDAPTGSVLISGTAALGQVLTASHTLQDLDGLGTVRWQWQADGRDIAGATGDQYTLGVDDIGKAITVVARYTDGYGYAEQVASAATSPVTDGNNVPRDRESQVPGLGGSERGDGNGDGVQDSLQPGVASTELSGAGGAPASFVTLVVDSVDGKVREGSQARLTDLHGQDVADLLPSWAQAPNGGLGFTAQSDAADGIERFSLYVDANLGINGYWVRNAEGVLVNLASEPYGGRMVLEGDKLRLDFQIQDGGEFDRSGAGDRLIVSDGVAARAELGLVGHVVDLPEAGGGAHLWD